MFSHTDILSLVRQSAAKRILVLPHAVRQMSRPDRMISMAEVHRVIENGEPIMKCMYCQGEMKQGTAPFHIDRKSYHLMLDTIPAWVCAQCGEVYFDEAEVDTIQQIIRAVDEKTEKMAVSA